MSEKEKLLRQSGKHYRVHWSGFGILICQVAIPLLVGGILQHFISGKNDLLDSAMPVYAFFLPSTVIAVILNMFMGRMIAVFEEKGFYGLQEVERSKVKNFDNVEKMVFIPYDSIQRIKYRPEATSIPRYKSDYSSVEVTYARTDEKNGEQYMDICVLRCGPFTREARDFARAIVKAIAKNSGRKLKIEKEKFSYYFFIAIIVMAYVFLFAVSW